MLGQTISAGLGSELWLVRCPELQGNLAIFWQPPRTPGSVAESNGENEWNFVYSKAAKLKWQRSPPYNRPGPAKNLRKG